MNKDKIRRLKEDITQFPKETNEHAILFLCDALLEEDEPICPLCQEVEHDHDCPNNKPSLHERMTEYSAGFGNGHRDGEKKERQRWIAAVRKECSAWNLSSVFMDRVLERAGVSDE